MRRPEKKVKMITAVNVIPGTPHTGLNFSSKRLELNGSGLDPLGVESCE